MTGLLFVWYAGLFVAIAEWGLSAYEAVAPAAVGGVLLKMVSDAWQFMWRKSSPQEEIKK